MQIFAFSYPFKHTSCVVGSLRIPVTVEGISVDAWLSSILLDFLPPLPLFLDFLPLLSSESSSSSYRQCHKTRSMKHLIGTWMTLFIYHCCSLPYYIVTTRPFLYCGLVQWHYNSSQSKHTGSVDLALTWDFKKGGFGSDHLTRFGVELQDLWVISGS